MGNKNEPLVSIITLVYNHDKYLRQCLDGFISQKTDFTFEVIIHDDASTDNSKAILEEYEKTYPLIIKPIYQSENQFSKGVRIGITYLYPKAIGKYIALCEGDDYWTDPYKLQKQVDFLEAHTNYSMCFHSAIELWEGQLRKTKVFSEVIGGDYSAKQIYKNWIIPTASVIFRKEVVESHEYKALASNPRFVYGDIILFLSCFYKGKVYGLPDIMSIYRRHEGGMIFKPSLERNFKQCVHDIEIGEKFADLGITDTANYLCSSRAINSFWYSLLHKKYRKLAKQFLKLFYRTKSNRLFFRYLTLSVSAVKNYNNYK